MNRLNVIGAAPENVFQGILFPKLTKEMQTEFQNLLKVIDNTFPLSAKHRSGLPRDVAELSRQLTSGRGSRVDGYLGQAAFLSAYLRYFLPWNVFRLLRLLPTLHIDLHDGDILCDLGSGPMTFALALWISRPDLRKRNLEIRCVDRTALVLEAGKKLFYALTGTSCSGNTSPWKIKTIRASLGADIYGEAASLVTAVNVYNELFWDDRNDLGKIVKREKNYLLSLVKKGGSLLIVEPGIPRSGEFISQLRESLLSSSAVSAPCPHHETCPFPGGKRGAKWCHFSFDTRDAPPPLHSLSKAAGIPKEHAVLSFLYTEVNSKSADSPPAALPEKNLKARIISDSIILGGTAANPKSKIKHDAQYGRYACSAKGMILVTGTKQSIENVPSGTLINLRTESQKTDLKTGAKMFELSDH